MQNAQCIRKTQMHNSCNWKFSCHPGKKMVFEFFTKLRAIFTRKTSLNQHYSIDFRNCYLKKRICRNCLSKFIWDSCDNRAANTSAMVICVTWAPITCATRFCIAKCVTPGIIYLTVVCETLKKTSDESAQLYLRTVYAKSPWEKTAAFYHYYTLIVHVVGLF